MNRISAQYFNLAEENSSKYGISLVQLIQIGRFYELWEEPDAPTRHQTYLQADLLTRGSPLDQASPIIDQVALLLNMRISPPERQRPLRQMGFPTHSLETHLNTLLENGRTVVVINEQGEALQGGVKQRAVSQVYFPSESTPNQSSSELPYILSLYFPSPEKLGLTIFSPMSGHSVMFPVSWEDRDKVARLLMSYHIREVVIYSKAPLLSNNYVLNNLFLQLLMDWGLFPSESSAAIEVLEAEGQVSLRYRNGREWLLLQVYGKTPPEWLNKNYQEHALNKIFNVSPLGLEQEEVSIISMLGVLQFVHIRNPELLKNISLPEYSSSVISPLNLVLCGRAESQLDLAGRGVGSILHLIDSCSTPMGRRLLKLRLLNPITDLTELNTRYEDVATLIQLINNDIIDKSVLRGIKDLTSLHRKWAICASGGSPLPPNKLGQIYYSYYKVSLLMKTLSTVGPCSLLREDFNLLRKGLESLLGEIDNVFQVGNLLDPGHESTLLHWNTVLTNLLEQQRTLRAQLTEWAERTSNVIFQNADTIKLGSDQDLMGTTFSIPSRKLSILERHIARGVSHPVIVLGKKGSTHIITSSSIQKELIECNLLEEQIREYIRLTYAQELKRLYMSFSSMFGGLEDFIAKLDVALSGAIVATKLGLTRPNVEPSRRLPNRDTPHQGALEAENLRHPLVEQLHTQEECVGHDIRLGAGGMLIFSVNGAGKSTLLRAIGVNTILAQAGMYVAADTFRFTPYNYLIASISGGDDLHRGYSAYGVKMRDLRTMVELSAYNTLVLGDEMCSGTDVNSGASILAATIERLSSTQTSFVLATHLHKVCALTESLHNIKFFHLSVIHKDLGLIYERKLKPGPGPAEYGIEVMRPIVGDEDLYNSALKYRDLLERGPSLPVLAKVRPSRYNPQVFLDLCEICGATAEAVHHIKPQRDWPRVGRAKRGSVNRKSNLVPVCSRCHLAIHKNQISILGWRRTPQHRKLDWEYVSKGLD
nr:MutS-like protein [Leptophyton benayahui]UKP88412.1 MutS-like protein [Leptophyton benayahui]